ncbi:MAG: nucleoside hydrolase [Anaerolineae bacterium]|nr:nucleoside hydrolase [Anaerolineae bacterium]
MRRFLIDTDTASDDAVALVMAARHPDCQIEAVTVVAGNVPLEQGVQNALYTLALCDRADIPVYAGAAAPLLRPLITAQVTHGNDGMGNIGLPLHGRTPAAGHAVDVLSDTIRRYPNEITLVTLGPLTNLALALLRDPGLAALVPRCVLMGGCADSRGNANPVAEYNIWTDPEAAQIVFESGLPLTMVGWDISRQFAVFDEAAAADLRAVGTPLAHFCVDIQHEVDRFARTVTRLAGFDLPDPITMAVALEPEIATTQDYYVAVETTSRLCRGQTVVDYVGLWQRPPNVAVTLSARRERFIELLKQALR